MDDLLARAIAAHGGFDRSNKFNKVTAAVVRRRLVADEGPRTRSQSPR